MWPHKKGLGIRLSYGIQGNATIQHESDNNTISAVFPRQNTQSPLAPSSPIQLVPPQIKINDNPSTVSSKGFPSNHSYVPQNLVSSFAIESTTVSSTISYDPTHGDIVNFINISNKPVMVHVTGETESILTFSDFDSSFPVELTFPIRQITSKVLHDGTTFIIRTPTRIYVITATLPKPTIGNINLSVIGEINVKDLANCEFADVVFGSRYQFAIVDIHGNFAVYTVIRKHPGISLSFKHISSHDVTELSKWKRIAFVEDTVVTLSRSKLISYTIPKAVSTDVITANTWSRLRDICTFQDNTFLLTTKELIWFNDKWERLLSWKHFLDDSDPSLRVHIYCEDNTFTCMLFTQTNPLIIVYTLGRVNDKPSSLCDPYYIRKSGETRQISVNISNGKLYQLNTDLSISCQSIQDTNIQSKLDSESTFISKLNTQQIFKSFTPKHIKSLSKALTPTSSTSETQQIHKYAYSLGSELANAEPSPSYFSLYDLCSDVPSVSDLLDLDDMIVQLESSVDNFKVVSLIHKLLQKYNGNGSHIDDIASLLDKIYGGKHQEVAVLLGTSNIKCQSKTATKLLEQEYEQKHESMSKQVRSIFDEWEDHGTQHEQEKPSQEVYSHSQVEAPSIRASHPLSQVVTASQSSQRKSRPSSQRLSQPKKKKKRGF
ncbi:uncharacterized protein SPAPADRAFT_48561 [Spathaspora passalidarum NRRL Y-27907]|uniref:RRN6 beta-propeller domain-containing protein n=1 Tax=Spathaspora passalidarum (strain NRRL Y-27907 / 11-Y1) TaxID=619300 RepID=G3AE45_SPAPN|nr:uncharacterized protein SPAPADRAFT_48561 [Spathaspora passalidarum NRRL Y-27907]EGW35579.1 hypothetical protein SPAPADRAFT_48561 [Spathaspora passalidarum NRRL Y-27907]